MYRKGVSAIILNKENQFLLVNLISFEEKFYAIPGGGLETNETLEEAVYREIKEELGIDYWLLEKVGKSDIPLFYNFKIPKTNTDGKEIIGSERYFFAFYFLGLNDQIKISNSEVRSYKWVDFNDLDKYLLFSNQLSDTKMKINELFKNSFDKVF